MIMTCDLPAFIFLAGTIKKLKIRNCETFGISIWIESPIFAICA